MVSTTLHLGCRVSKDRFSILWPSDATWCAEGCKWFFLLSYDDFEFLIELSHDNARQIELHCQAGHDAKFLLFQLHRAPNIYEKCKYDLIPLGDDPWMRTYDSTPSSSIGQSSHVCLKLPSSFQFQNFKGNFEYYHDSEIILKKGYPFSQSVLVPIVDARDFHLPYDIQFKISSLVQKGIVPGLTLDDAFFRLVDPREMDIGSIKHALDKLLQLKVCCYEPVRWLKEEYQHQPRKLPHVALNDGGLLYVRQVKITPSKLYFYGPVPTKSNCVLRHFSQDLDNFLRVSFVDEDFSKLFAFVVSRRLDLMATKTIRTGVGQRIADIIGNGIVIGDKKFEFLAFSPSQLKSNSLWMFARKPGHNAADIRTWMGDFSQIRNVAKYAARLGQSLSASTETLDVYQDEIEIIPDVEDSSSGTKYVFSDGIGKISKEFASRVAKKCGLETTPSAFQIRYGGYKGVVAVDPTSSLKLSFRSSMRKFESSNTKLDVLEVTKNQPFHLNRQLIVLLSTLGVNDGVFEKKQEEAVGQWYTVSTDPSKALELLSPGEITNICKEMLICGYKPHDEPFLSMMLQVFEASKLMGLRTKTRIYIPNGRCMMGCLDETRTLEYGEVFV